MALALGAFYTLSLDCSSEPKVFFSLDTLLSRFHRNQVPALRKVSHQVASQLQLRLTISGSLKYTNFSFLLAQARAVVSR